jgi:hypothetical protein
MSVFYDSRVFFRGGLLHIFAGYAAFSGGFNVQNPTIVLN